jgi:hypothetical protein
VGSPLVAAAANDASCAAAEWDAVRLVIGGLAEHTARWPWFSRSCFTKSDDKVPIVLLLKYYTYNRGATAQTPSAGGPGLIAPGGTPGKIKWPELGVTELRFGDRLDPADSD